MRRTLAMARADARVYEIEKYSASNDGIGFEEAGYCISLNDGYEFDDGSCTQYVRTVKEVWMALDTEVIKIGG